MGLTYQVVALDKAGKEHVQHQYAGFTRFNGMPGPQGATRLALVMDEGQPYIWWLDDSPRAIEELQRYYKDNCPWALPLKGSVPVSVYTMGYPVSF